MTRLLLFLAAFHTWSLALAMKIAFLGDTGLADRRSYGYGDLTMKMCEDQGVDLVVDVGDFEYWGVCTESYNTTIPFQVASTVGRIVQVPANSVLKRYKWQDGKHGSTEGWDIGVEFAQDDGLPAAPEGTDITLLSADLDRFVISDEAWYNISASLNKTYGCWDEPWDGPYRWNQFLRDHDFDFLGAAGNSEVKLSDGYGSAEIWASHQNYMHNLYMDRIYNTGKGACHGYFNQQEPGTIQEYGERYSCFYKHNENEDFHFIFLGWWQGSDEHWSDESTQARNYSIDFIEREFSSPRSENARWRFCIHHMTSAKLSAGDERRDHMGLSGITDACRRHGALIISGHHHLYSRTKLLQGVGGPDGNDTIVIADSIGADGIQQAASIVREGVTMSITVGMGGYDSSCNGMYANATWMETCVASLTEHRGAVIAEFDAAAPWSAKLQYLNSMDDAAIVDEFTLTSRLPGWNTSVAFVGTSEPTDVPIPVDETDTAGRPVSESGEPPLPVEDDYMSQDEETKSNAGGRISFSVPMIFWLAITGVLFSL